MGVHVARMVDSIFTTRVVIRIPLCFLLLLLGLKEDSEIFREWQFIKSLGLLWIQKAFHHISFGDYLWFWGLNTSCTQEQRWDEQAALTNTRETHCLKTSQNICSYHSSREDETFNPSPTGRKQVRSQVSIWNERESIVTW